MRNSQPTQSLSVLYFRKTNIMLENFHDNLMEASNRRIFYQENSSSIRALTTFLTQGIAAPAPGQRVPLPSPAIDATATQFAHMSPHKPLSINSANIPQSHAFKNSDDAIIGYTGPFQFEKYDNSLDFNKDRKAYIKHMESAQKRTKTSKQKNLIKCCKTCGHIFNYGPFKESHPSENASTSTICTVKEADHVHERYHGWCSCVKCKWFANEDVYKIAFPTGGPRRKY